MRLKNLIALVALIVVAGSLLIGWRVRIKHGLEELADRDLRAAVPIEADDPRWGSPRAPVTIVLFGDLQSPFLGPVWSVLARVKAQYGPEKVRIVWKNRPALFHPEARSAACAAQAVYLARGSDAYWAFVDRVLWNQDELGPAAYERWATDVGVELAAFRARSASKELRARVAAPVSGLITSGEDAVTIYVNGLPPTRLSNDPFSSTELNDYRAIVDAQLKLAATLQTPHYAAMSEENRERERKSARQGGTRAYQRPNPVAMPIGLSPVRGSPNAIVTVVALSDFTSPESRLFAARMRALEAQHGDKVRLVWKHRPLPFDPRAEPAAELAIEAQLQKGNDGFWRAHDLLFASASLERADLERIAGELGLDLNAVRVAIDEKKHKARIDGDQRLAMNVERQTIADEATYPRVGTVDGGITPLVAVNTLPVRAEDSARLGATFRGPDIQWVVDEALATFEKEHGEVEAKDWYEHLLSEVEYPAPDAHRRGVSFDGVRLSGDRVSRDPGAVSRELIEGAIDRSAIGRCHEQALKANPFLRGRVIVEVMIDTGGKVVLVQDGGSSLPDPAALACVREAIRGLSFPAISTPFLPFVTLFLFEAPT